MPTTVNRHRYLASQNRASKSVQNWHGLAVTCRSRWCMCRKSNSSEGIQRCYWCFCRSYSVYCCYFLCGTRSTSAIRAVWPSSVAAKATDVPPLLLTPPLSRTALPLMLPAQGENARPSRTGRQAAGARRKFVLARAMRVARLLTYSLFQIKWQCQLCPLCTKLEPPQLQSLSALQPSRSIVESGVVSKSERYGENSVTRHY